MSFPQPQPTPYVVNNYQFFDINTPLSCPGDIYESNQGGHMFCVGPQSDIANINMAYFDDQAAPSLLRQTTISPTRSFVGEIYARNESRYAPADRPGVILYWPADIYDPNFRPRGFSTDDDSIEFVAPQFNVIQYFAPVSSLVPQRIDKEFTFQNYIVPTGGVLYLVIPYYGRKYCYINFTNRNATSANTFGISAVNYAITQDDGSNPYHQQTTIHAPASVSANGGTVTQIVKAGTQGMFDALVFSLTQSGPAPLRITMSDQDAS